MKILHYICVTCLMAIGLSVVSAQQIYKAVSEQGHLKCQKLQSFIKTSDTSIYYSYYYCHGSAIDDTPDLNFSPRSTIFFIGTPDTSGSGYFEFETVSGNFTANYYSPLLRSFDLVFIDMPGVGYSSIYNRTYLRSMVLTIETDLADAVLTIVAANPKIFQQYFYLYGESYGTKFIPKIALKLFDMLSLDLRTMFQGIFLGSPFISPLDQVGWSDRLFSDGFIDRQHRSKFSRIEGQIQVQIGEENFNEATKLFKMYQEKLHFVSGGLNKCDLSTPICVNDFEGRSLQSQDSPRPVKDIRSLIGCEESDWHAKLQYRMNSRKPAEFNSSWGALELQVVQFLGSELMVSVSQDVEHILNNTDLNIFIISGQNDLIGGPSSMSSVLDYLIWSSKDGFFQAPYRVIRGARQPIVTATCNDVIGYKKQYGQLTIFTLRKTGHRLFYKTDGDHNPLNNLESVFGIAVGLESVLL